MRDSLKRARNVLCLGSFAPSHNLGTHHMVGSVFSEIATYLGTVRRANLVQLGLARLQLDDFDRFDRLDKSQNGKPHHDGILQW